MVRIVPLSNSIRDTTSPACDSILVKVLQAPHHPSDRYCIHNICYIILQSPTPRHLAEADTPINVIIMKFTPRVLNLNSQ